MKTPSPEEVERFRRWALSRYTQRSTAKLMADVLTACRNDGLPPEAERRAARLKDYAWAWDVWGDARADGVDLKPLPITRPEVPPAPKRGGRRAREPKRLREARAMTSTEYEAMLDALAKEESAAGRAVYVMARTGLRVSDVLRISIPALRRALAEGEGAQLPVMVKGDKPALVLLEPAFDAWLRLGQVAWMGAKTIADVVTGQPFSDTEANGAAYERCRRIIKKLAPLAEGRVHLHRLRRTVGVELLRRGASIEDVQQALIHDSVKTTEKSYTDEYRAGQAARALGKLRGRP